MLAYIIYVIVTVIIRFLQREANLAAAGRAGRLVVGIACRLPARYTRRIIVVRPSVCDVRASWIRITKVGNLGN